MDSRTRERLPVLPVLARSAAGHHDRTAEHAEGRAGRPAWRTFTAGGHAFTRTAARKPGIRTWARDSDGNRHDLTWEEDHAFWTWAIIEVLRATGIRVEELLELTHHSLIQYRLPSTGELVPLLQIAPSKTDTERLLVVSPDLADVLAAIITRLAAPGREDPADRPLRRARACLAASGPAAVPAPQRHRAPAHLLRHHPEHAQRGARPAPG